MQSDTHAIDVQNVSKKYGDFTAVNDVSFTVRQGRTFGLLGPNGAGKTTTIRMIMNITIPDSGAITVLGRPSTEGGAIIGYLPEERGLYRKMKVLDHLIFLGEIRGIDRAEAKRRASKWLERMGLADRASKKVEELSKGMQQKIQFIGSIIHEPQVMILDEPFSGLDPVNALLLKELLQEFKDQGRTLILSTHVMEQAERLCDEIALINRSRVVLSGEVAEVKRRFSGNRLQLSGRGDVNRLRSLPGVLTLEQRGEMLEVELDESRRRADFLRDATAVFDLDKVVPHEATLDEIFVKVVGRDVTAVEGENAA